MHKQKEHLPRYIYVATEILLSYQLARKNLKDEQCRNCNLAIESYLAQDATDPGITEAPWVFTFPVDVWKKWNMPT